MVTKIVKAQNILCLFFTVSIGTVAYADTNNSIKQCTMIQSNSKRLACFDNLFGTPVRAQNIDEKTINSVIPQVVSNIFMLAQNNKNDMSNSVEDELQIALNNEDKDEDKDQAIMYIACKDNITRFQIALKEPIKKNPIKVEIQDQSNGKTVSNINWQSTERGYLLDVGRGLYAIQQLKSMLYANSFNVIISEEKRTFQFKANGLASRIAPIREECGW